MKWKLGGLSMEATDKEIILKAAEIMYYRTYTRFSVMGSCDALEMAYLCFNVKSGPGDSAIGSFYLKQRYCKFYGQPMATLWDVTPEERVILLLFFAEAGDL
jgi:hypothetical protein